MSDVRQKYPLTFALCLLTFVVLTLPSCQYVVSPAHAPMAMVGAYELSKRRERWLEYAQQGDVYAQFELAESYRNGGLEGDVNGAEAWKWYCKAAQSGYVNAQLVLGQLYENTLEIPDFPVVKDNARAYMWYRMAVRRVSEEARERREQMETTMTAQEKRDASYLLQAPKHVPCTTTALPWQAPSGL